MSFAWIKSRRAATALLSGLLLTGSVVAPAAVEAKSAGATTVYAEGEVVKLTPAPYVDKKSVFRVPMRGIFAAYGVKLHWNPETGAIKAYYDGNTVVVYPNKNKATMNGKDLWMKDPVTVVKGNVMVPLFFVSCTLNVWAKYNYPDNVATFSRSGDIH
ncbi:copper amine oxidase N-terminal domain-containing protein [Paenibacillus pasadenensis]|uniref:copper amine oxidase N-terminal domain-containing protein n=1 Tax=Paenibacillus pasadenensis TaxID=217090 RepID=UPI00203F6F00|nr:copper amine oxidase N-terminal domain-containing protein [Paenibacillus pasadenensis]MCM3746628.1 copper amine oxidase N-terminal domain-containing protein [Paenibacillus pasadenensis]